MVEKLEEGQASLPEVKSSSAYSFTDSSSLFSLWFVVSFLLFSPIFMAVDRNALSTCLRLVHAENNPRETKAGEREIRSRSGRNQIEIDRETIVGSSLNHFEKG